MSSQINTNHWRQHEVHDVVICKYSLFAGPPEITNSIPDAPNPSAPQCRKTTTKKKAKIDPDEALNHLHTEIIEALNQKLSMFVNDDFYPNIVCDSYLTQHCDQWSSQAERNKRTIGLHQAHDTYAVKLSH